jgi:cell division protein FtsL
MEQWSAELAELDKDIISSDSTKAVRQRSSELDKEIKNLESAERVLHLVKKETEKY